MLVKTRKRLNDINILRGIAILAVVLIHITSVYVEFPKNSGIYSFYGVMNTILSFAVPVFIFISAFGLMYQLEYKKKLDIKDFYFKRFNKVLVFYIIWTLIYLLYFQFILGQPIYNMFTDTWNFIYNYFILGKACYHLYFVPIIIQFYIVFPILWFVISRLFKKVYFKTEKRERIYNVVMFSLINVLLLLLQYLFFDYNANYLYQKFQNTGSLLLSYIIPLGMGLWIGQNWYEWKDIRKFLRIIIYPIAIVSGFIFINYTIGDNMFGIKGITVGLVRSIYVSFMCVILLDLAMKINENKNSLNKILTKLGKHSFAIYLIHPLIMFLLDGVINIKLIGNEFWDFSINLLCNFGVVILISYGTIFVVKKIKYFYFKISNLDIDAIRQTQ